MSFNFKTSDTARLRQQTRGQVDFGQYCLNLLISQTLGLSAVKRKVMFILGLQDMLE